MSETITAVLERLNGQPERFAELRGLMANVRWRRQLLDHADEVTRQKSARYESAMRRREKFYAELVRREGERFKGPEQMEAVDELVQQYPQILRAIQTALGRSDAELLAVFAKYLALPLQVKSRFQDGVALFEQLLDKARLLDNHALQVTAGLNYGQFLFRLGRFDQANKLLEQVSTDAIAENDEDSLAASLLYLGFIAEDQGGLVDAIEYFERSLAIYRRLGDRKGEAAALASLGRIARMQYRYPDARRLLSEATGVIRGVSDLWLNLIIQGNLVRVAMDEGNLIEAQRGYKEILLAHEGIGDWQGLAITLSNLGIVSCVLGKDTEGEHYFRRAIQVFQTIGDRTGECCNLNNLACCFVNQGRFSEASKQSAASLAIAREQNLRGNIAAALHAQAYSAYGLGNYHEALPLLEECITISQEIGQTEYLGNHFIDQAMVHYATRDYARAEASAKLALENYREINDKSHVAKALCVLALVGTRNGSTSDSVGLLADGMTTAKSTEGPVDKDMLLFAGMILVAAGRNSDGALILYGFQHHVSVAGYPQPILIANELEEGLSNLAGLLPPKELARLKTQAEAMSLEELTDYALKALGELQQSLAKA